MNKKVSYIVPCYNCESTVEAAVESIFKQETQNFEVVMVDDCSTDNTLEKINILSKKHPEIVVLRNESNMGGGATRNKAISESSGDIMVILDSDDLLPEDTIPKIIDFIEISGCDGALYENTLFFEGNDLTKIEAKENKITGREITLEDLFKKDSGFLTRVNFVFKKNAFFKTQGYPTEHGFDTQGFGFRFLLANNKVRVCPSTGYLHRRNNNTSYFLREYNEGKFSFNNYLIFEEFLHIFSNEVIDSILNFDIFSRKYLGEDNLENFMYNLYDKYTNNFFIKNYTDYTSSEGCIYYLNSIATESPTKIFLESICSRKNNNKEKALKILTDNEKIIGNYKLYKLNINLCKNSPAETFKIMKGHDYIYFIKKILRRMLQKK